MFKNSLELVQQTQQAELGNIKRQFLESRQQSETQESNLTTSLLQLKETSGKEKENL